MDYEEKVIDGVCMIAFKGCWYPLDETPLPYEEKVEDGMIQVLVNGHWYPVAEAVQDEFPFYDLTDRDLNALFGYGPSPQDLYELFHDPPDEDPPPEYPDSDEDYE
jgi:hypothetical protein